MATNKKTTKVAAGKTKVQFPDKFTTTSIANYIAEKHDLPKKQAKAIMDDLFEVMNAGVLTGERVPVGTIGKLFVRVRPATKPRIGRNPATARKSKYPQKKPHRFRSSLSRKISKKKS